jgi:hypothetical protein
VVPVRRAAFVAGIAGVALLVSVKAPMAQVAVLALVAAGLATWYRSALRRRSPRLVNALLVLTKYPALVIALAPALDGHVVRAAIVAAVAYLIAVAYELAHTPTLVNGATA